MAFMEKSVAEKSYRKKCEKFATIKLNIKFALPKLQPT